MSRMLDMPATAAYGRGDKDALHLEEGAMTTAWTLGSAAAVGIGVGAAFAASMGTIGYLFGLIAWFGTVVVGREVRRRR
jgi:hypothetical protein